MRNPSVRPGDLPSCLTRRWSLRLVGCLIADLAGRLTGETVTKCDREIMEILEAYDTTGCAHSAAQLVGCDPKTVRRYAALREAGGGDPVARAAARRPKLIDAFLPKVEELVDQSKARIRADKV